MEDSDRTTPLQEQPISSSIQTQGHFIPTSISGQTQDQNLIPTLISSQTKEHIPGMNVLKFGIVVCFGLLALAAHYYHVSVIIRKYDEALSQVEKKYEDGMKEIETICEGRILDLREKCKILNPSLPMDDEKRKIPNPKHQFGNMENPKIRRMSGTYKYSFMDQIFTYILPIGGTIGLVGLACAIVVYCKRSRNINTNQNGEPIVFNSIAARPRINTPRPPVKRLNFPTAPRDYPLQPTPSDF